MDNPLKIYSGSDALLHTTPINTGCRRRVQLMTEDSITVKFSDKNRMTFPVGSHIGNFFITESQQGKYNAATDGYDYELKFNAYYWLWANRLLYYVMPGVENAPKETSFKLTATIDVHAAMILRALNALGFTYDGSPFRVDTDEGFSTEAKYISYANMSILGGIQAIADAYECEWWVVGNSIHFGKCNAIGEYDFTAGDNVSAITPSSNNKQANRLIIFGSDRNLPPNYRSAGDSDITDAVVQRRLMLPEGTPWLQTAENIPDDEIVEEEVVFDSVYPRTSLTVSKVIPYEKQNEDGKTQTFYRIKYGDSFKFSESYKLPDTDEFHIVFESGDLNGMDFTARFNPLGVGEKLDDGSWNPDAQMFEIIVNEDYGRELPDTVLHPAETDKFAIHGWDATKMESLGLVDAAEQELLAEGQKEIEERKKDLTTYTCPMMWDWCKAQSEKHDMPQLGSVVNLHFTAGDAGRKSRVIGFEHDLDIEYSNVTYTCGEKVSASRLKTLEIKVEGLTHDGAAAKVQNSLDFLSKRYSDRTPHALNVGGLLTAENGAQFSESFAEGLTGFGARINDGHGEMDSLALRHFLEVPEIRKNKITVTGGVIWNAPGSGIVEHVTPSPDTPNTGSFRLKLEDGEIGEFAVGDIVMGVWHYFEDGLKSSNLTEAEVNAIRGAGTSDGEFVTAGFCTVWLTVTSVSGDSNEIVSYQLRTDHITKSGAVPPHPHEAMHLVAYGSMTDKTRQRSIYMTRGYLRLIQGVNQYQFQPDNVAAQFGDLDALNIGGVQMSGYSIFLRNIYMTGHIHQIFAPMLDIRMDLSALVVSTSQTAVLTPVPTIDGKPDTQGQLTVTGWKVTRDSGDATADAAWNALAEHSAYDGSPLTILHSDLNGKTSARFTVSATIKATRGGGSQQEEYTEPDVTSMTAIYAVPSSATYRGPWAEGENYFAGGPGEELTQVSHNGVRWQCLSTHVSDASNAPGYRSAKWLAVEGYLKPHVTFDEDSVTVIKGHIDETLTAVVTMYGEDISEDASVSYKWTRRSWSLQSVGTGSGPSAAAKFTERTGADDIWNNQNHTGRTLHFTDADMDWADAGGPAKLMFIVTVTVTEPGKAAKKAMAAAEF